MRVNWQQGFSRLAVASRWAYLGLAVVVLATSFFDRMRGYYSDGYSGGDYVWEWVRLGPTLYALTGWALAWVGTYFALKYTFRAIRWVGAGFASPKP